MFKKMISLFITVCMVLSLGVTTMAATPENTESEAEIPLSSFYTAEDLGIDENTIFTDEEASRLSEEISKRYIEEAGFSTTPNPMLRNSVSGLHGTAALYLQGSNLYWGTSLRSGGAYRLIATVTVYKNNYLIGSWPIDRITFSGSLDGWVPSNSIGKDSYKAYFSGGFYGANGNGIFIGSIASGCQTSWTK